METDHLERIVLLLQHRCQVIFYGPPGTGKTYVARKLATHLTGDQDRVQLVQFHPSYAYEDFVEGYRPTRLEGGAAGFALREGPLKRIARQAAKATGETFVLIIDEINRGTWERSSESSTSCWSTGMSGSACSTRTIRSCCRRTCGSSAP